MRWNKKKNFNESSFGIAIGDQIRLENILKQSIILVMLLILSVIIYDNIDEINEIKIIFLKIGSLMLLVLAFYVIKYSYGIYNNVKYLIKLSSDKTKSILIIFFLLLVFYFYFNQEEIISEAIELITRINYSSFNPFYFEISENSIGDEDFDYKYTDTTISKPDIDTSELEWRIHELINEERRKNGLQALQWDEDLAGIARSHSKDMSIFGYFDHINLHGEDPTARGSKVGYTCYKDYGSYYTYGIAENIFLNHLYDTVWYTNGVIESYDWNTQENIAQSTVDGWMDSPGHRSNILDTTYDKEGIGVAISVDYEVYVTQDFC